MSYAEDFKRGARDCREGVPHKDGSKGYNAGYKAQAQMDEMKSYKSASNEEAK